jgi:type I restriction enzyme S subunit
MIENLKPYPEYKDSGLPWLGQVPAHWEIRRGKSVFSESNLPVRDGDEIVTCFRDGQVTLRKNRRTSGFMTALYEAGYQGVRTGQLVIHAMDAFAGAIGISDSDGKCTPEYIVLDPLSNSAHPSYFSQLLRHAARQQFILVQCPAVRERAPRFRYPNFGCMWMPLPPANEQAAIARFLAWATNRLDRAIGAKRRIIALLQEQKQAIIHRAVTRGLNPSVPLKDSGIPWLGEIPVHWEVLALKRVLSRLVDCEHKTAPFVQQSNYRVVRTSAVRNGLLRWSGTYCTSAKAFTEWTQRAVPEAGDVIFTREAPAGEACIIPEDARVCLGQRTVLMKPQRGIYDSQFLVHMIYAGPPRQLIELTCQGSTVSHFNMDDIGWMKILAPPLSEQIEIIAKVTELTEAPFLVIDKTEREITLLREYRTRLIADVVTGKLDVREMAKELPEEELQDQPDVEAVYDAGDSEEDPESDLIDTAED